MCCISLLCNVYFSALQCISLLCNAFLCNILRCTRRPVINADNLTATALQIISLLHWSFEIALFQGEEGMHSCAYDHHQCPSLLICFLAFIPRNAYSGAYHCGAWCVYYRRFDFQTIGQGVAALWSLHSAVHHHHVLPHVTRHRRSKITLVALSREIAGHQIFASKQLVKEPPPCALSSYCSSYSIKLKAADIVHCTMYSKWRNCRALNIADNWSRSCLEGSLTTKSTIALIYIPKYIPNIYQIIYQINP